GFLAAGARAAIKTNGLNDIGLLMCQSLATAAAAFTTNRVCAAPVIIGRRHIADGVLRAIVVNSGNANACTGRRGLNDALRMCRVVSRQLRCPPKQVLPSSTGIIGHPLPMAKVCRGIVEASKALGNSLEHAQAFADAILTTDTRRKSAGTTLRINGRKVLLCGICKGAGMIGPRLQTASRRVGGRQATMLAYLTTDARVAAPTLRRLLQPAVDGSFNSLTIDDHTSTNDTCAILASGVSDVPVESARAQRMFLAALTEVCQSLAEQVAADGEGATKVVRIEVSRAASEHDARSIARAIANSPLVKCAMHGNDPNWGRIISAAGMCEARFEPERATLTLQGIPVFRRGKPVNFDPASVSRALQAREVVVGLNCGCGKASAGVWTCDLSEEYVSINADYHT
ncbi:MAG: bifunctional glutamate N-acetyltransferase/amino-acid acetyltransferase ArgJ, partial [Phycisphaerales bacterium]|nr:bifunctional glutamate N-acetyltransferase/amino-acid acetyltransferase ArgJ [Phycisphaerales bacterium]